MGCPSQFCRTLLAEGVESDNGITDKRFTSNVDVCELCCPSLHLALWRGCRVQRYYIIDIFSRLCRCL